MSEQPNTTLKCGQCSNAVKESDDHCHNCGAMFKEGFVCIHHRSRAAVGVCVICKRPFCDECGSDVMNVFFCSYHSNYEFHEGMPRVFGHTDNVLVQHVTQCLQQAGFHPFLFSRWFSPSADFARWIPFRTYGRTRAVDLKVLVPFSEVIDAEKTLRSLSLFSL
jgi:hypothetical protein